MKNSRTFFGRLLRGAAVTALSAVLLSALPVLKADAAAGMVTLSADGTLTLSGEVTKEQIGAYRENDAVKAVTAKKGTVLPADCSHLFQNYLARTIDLSNASSSAVTDMGWMFSECWMLTSLDLSSFDTSNVTDMGDMFHYCPLLTSLDLSGFDTSNVTNMGSMFENCEKLTSLDLSSFDTSSVEYMSSMFNYCSNLTAIYVSDRWSNQAVRYGSKMFEGCASLTGGNGTKYTKVHMDTEYARIDADGRPGYFTDSFFRSMPKTKNAYGTVAENAVFTVKVTDKNLKYQWQYNNGHGWRNSTQEGCKTATLSVPFLYYRNGQQYRCIVTAPNGITEISKEVKLTVK